MNYTGEEQENSGGLTTIFRNFQNLFILILRVLSNSIIRYGRIPFKIDALEISMFFGNPESFVVELLMRYQKIFLAQLKNYFTAKSMIETINSFSSYATLCFLSTASDVTTVNQLMLSNIISHDNRSSSGSSSSKSFLPTITNSNNKEDNEENFSTKTSEVILRLKTSQKQNTNNTNNNGNNNDNSNILQDSSKLPTTFLDGVFKSVIGIIQDPLIGVKKNGMIGLMTGLLKGTLGFTIRPTYGLLNQVKDLTTYLSKPYLSTYYYHESFNLKNIENDRDDNVLFQYACLLENSDLIHQLYITPIQLLICVNNSSLSTPQFFVTLQIQYFQIESVSKIEKNEYINSSPTTTALINYGCNNNDTNNTNDNSNNYNNHNNKDDKYENKSIIQMELNNALITIPIRSNNYLTIDTPVNEPSTLLELPPLPPPLIQSQLSSQSSTHLAISPSMKNSFCYGLKIEFKLENELSNVESKESEVTEETSTFVSIWFNKVVIRDNIYSQLFPYQN